MKIKKLIVILTIMFTIPNVVNAAATSWANKSVDYDNGLVIEDKKGNQFVWVPAGKYGYSSHYGATGSSDLSVNEQNQINKYGGFWIARYEASNTSNQASSMPNKPSWVSINYTDSKARAESFDSSFEHSSNGYWESSLMTGKMWDTTIKWIASDGTNVDSDSTLWGNYYNANVTNNSGNIIKSAGSQVVLNTGVTNYTKRKNMYDIAGNVWEWTNEISSTDRLCRGGSYFSSGNDYPASFRHAVFVRHADYYYGFRLSLYIL